MSSTQAEILSYLDKEDGVSGDGEVIGAEEFADRDVRKLASALDKAISFNEARRSKYDNPAMYPLSLSGKASQPPRSRLEDMSWGDCLGVAAYDGIGSWIQRQIYSVPSLRLAS